MKIGNTDKLLYLERMIQPYEKKNQKKYPKPLILSLNFICQV